MRISLGILLLIPTLAGAQLRPAFKPRPHEPPVIRILEPGQAPLAALRYDLRPGAQTVRITANGQMEVSRTGQQSTIPFPTMTLPVQLTAVKKGVGYTWLKPSFTTVPEDKQTGHLMTALESSAGTMTMASDGRGVITNILVAARPGDTGTNGGIETRSLMAMEMGKAILSLLEVPLPAEPIGVGGRWQVERIAVRGVLSLRQFTTFTLVGRKGSQLTVSYRLGGTWDPGSGLREEELKLAVSGEGTCTVDLGLPMPTALTDEVLVKATMTAANGQQTFQTTRVGTRIESQ